MHTLVSSAVVPMMRVGFLPVIPKPITERATVRHCLANLQSVRRQLNQRSMAIWCDEGVFAPAADIYLEETDKFKDMFLCLGHFHWTRVLLRCQGKLLRRSGPDDALIDIAVFGPGVIESVLNGSHYVRALTGMLIVEDTIKSLQWQMFWHDKDKAEYPVLTQLRALQTTLAANQCCPQQFDALIGQLDELRHDFREFEKQCKATSECDCINYLRHGSWYLEQISVLEFTHPELH